MINITCFWPFGAILGPIWHTKKYLVNLQKFWDLGRPPPHVGKNSQIISFFLFDSVPKRCWDVIYTFSWTSKYMLSIKLAKYLGMLSRVIMNNLHWHRRRGQTCEINPTTKAERHLCPVGAGSEYWLFLFRPVSLSTSISLTVGNVPATLSHTNVNIFIGPEFDHWLPLPLTD